MACRRTQTHAHCSTDWPADAQTHTNTLLDRRKDWLAGRQKGSERASERERDTHRHTDRERDIDR
eukprot:2982649-Rhodomonas_salina.1